jgi:hypothetical protein
MQSIYINFEKGFNNLLIRLSTRINKNLPKIIIKKFRDIYEAFEKTSDVFCPYIVKL